MKKLFWILAAGVTVLGFGCKGGDSSQASGTTPSGSATAAPAADSNVVLNGSGATFPNPLYQKWIQEYQRANPKVKINYQSVGSGAGIKAITDKTVDFGASDAPMSDEQLGKAGAKLLHVPMTLGAVVVTYNVAGAPDHLKLSPEVLAGMFLGDIKKWNDPKITALNAGAKLPDTAVGIVYRSDGSGTTAVFTDYLSKVSPDWKTKIGTGTSVKWPTGTGANKNDGVTNQIKQTPGAVGYIELAYAVQTQQPTASLKNKSGKFVDPSLDAITAAAAASSSKIPDDLRVSITDAEGDAAYPISAFTYILVYQDMTDASKAKALADFLWWGVHDGQKLGAPLQYAVLPAEVVTKDEAKLKSLTAGGKTLLAGK
jgi:phosphate transport system substrate-binding protein